MDRRRELVDTVETEEDVRDLITGREFDGRRLWGGGIEILARSECASVVPGSACFPLILEFLLWPEAEGKRFRLGTRRGGEEL